MKNKRSSILAGMLIMALLQFAVMSSHAQIVSTNGNTVIINNFDTSDQVYNNNGFPWENWFGAAYSNVVWSASDASNNPSSGSMEILSYFPDGGVGGGNGPQFLAYCGNSPFSPAFAGDGSTATNYVATNFTCDVRFDPVSATNANGTFPTIEFGTRGTAFGQLDFGTVSIQATNTNWVHVSIPITPNASWATIPNVYIKIYSSSLGSATTNVPEFLYVDNIALQFGIVQLAPPTMSIQKSPGAGLRIFAGSSANTYDREQLTSVDQNQSWVGGAYPVSYSYTLKSFPAITNSNQIFRFHIFLVPVNAAGGNSFANNEYIEYQANNDLWFNLSATTPSNVLAEVAWKTNLPNANPNFEVISNYFPSAVGTWTLTFSNATSGALTGPGASPLPFTIADSSIAADFGNPLVAFFGVQPDSGYGEGKYTDVSKISTVGVASPGVAINDDFTSDSILNTNVWNVGNSANTNSLVLATTNSAYWVSWTYPDFGFGLGTKADLSNASIAWKTPSFYANYVTNGPTAPFTATEGPNIWSLIPYNALPTVDGTSNGVQSVNAFFRLSSPPPAQ